MDDVGDPMPAGDRAHEVLIAHVADDQRSVRGHRPAEAGREIIEDDDALACIKQLEHHLASDVPGSAGDKDTHLCCCLFAYETCLVRVSLASPALT